MATAPDNVCQICNKVCKNSRGLDIHHRTCKPDRKAAVPAAPAKTPAATEDGAQDAPPMLDLAHIELMARIRREDRESEARMIIEQKRIELEATNATQAEARFRAKEARLAEEARTKAEQARATEERLAEQARATEERLAEEARTKAAQADARFYAREERLAREAASLAACAHKTADSMVDYFGARALQVRVETRMLTQRDADLRMYGGAKFAYFHADDIVELMAPFGAGCQKAIANAATVIVHEGQNVQAIDVALAEDVTTYVQAIFPDRTYIGKEWTARNTDLIAFQPTLHKAKAASAMPLTVAHPKIELPIRKSFSRGGTMKMIQSAHTLATSLVIQSRTYYAGDLSTYLTHNLTSDASASFMHATRTLPGALASRAKEFLRMQVASPGNPQLAVVARAMCEASLRKHFSLTNAPLGDMSLKIHDPTLKDAVEAIRKAGNCAAHSGGGIACTTDTMVIMAHLLQVLRKCWPQHMAR